MSRPSNDAYYVSLLTGVAARSTCLRRQVGAIITDENHRVLAMGFNGVPRGFPHCGERVRNIDVSNFNEPNAWILGKLHPMTCEGRDDPAGDTRRCNAVHAEINALMTADLRFAHTLYVSCTPCRQCALAIANTNIKQIVCIEMYADDARHVLNAAGIKLRFVPKETV